MNPHSIFLSSPQDPDPYYLKLRDSKDKSSERAYVEQSWSIYKSFCPDQGFINQFAKDPFSSLWHLHLARLLLDSGIKLLKTCDAQPDLCLKIQGKRTWIEVVCTKSGDGADAVRVAPSGVGAVPERQIILRITNALQQKVNQHCDFLTTGAGRGDRYIVALSSGLVPLAELNCGVTNIEKILFGIGNPQWELNMESFEVTSFGYQERQSITKASGATVPTNFFKDDVNIIVSGVLFSPYVFCNHWNCGGNDLLLIRNPQARYPLPDQIFSFEQSFFGY